MTASNTSAKEGKVVFSHASLLQPVETWYKVVGNLKSSRQPPVIVVHGGPGWTHNYLLSLSALATQYDIPVVFYDQLGNGMSTHLPEKRGDESLWTVDLFIAELDNLLEKLDIGSKFDVLGHSWGGMLAASFAIRGHQGLRRLILADAPASWRSLDEANKFWCSTLSNDIQESIKQFQDKDWKEPGYQEVYMQFATRFACRVNPWPQDLLDTFMALGADDTVSATMYGPGPFSPTGCLRDFSMIGHCHNIKVPTLLLNGEFDQARDSCLQPFFAEVPRVKWYKFPGASHCPHLEVPDRYLEEVSKFLSL